MVVVAVERLLIAILSGVHPRYSALLLVNIAYIQNSVLDKITTDLCLTSVTQLIL